MHVVVVIPNFNSAATVERAAEAMLRQRVSVDDSFQVVIVDDGSTDGSADKLASRFGETICLIRLPVNQGRSTARNAGAAALDCDLIIFVDSDCVPPDEGFIAVHLKAAEMGADVSFGAVSTPGSGFWDRIQRDASAWRLRRFEAGDVWTFTTQNVAMRPSIFELSGRFDAAFDRHGFEDRDLFIRLADAGADAWYTPAAVVIHEDRIGLASVAHKFGEAGYNAAHLFRAKHPTAYSRMAYSRLDCHIRPWLVWVDRALWPLARFLARGHAAWLEWPWLPFRLRATIARGVYGLSFLHGTVQSRKDNPVTMGVHPRS